jgi:hypothetical protein
MEHENEPNGPPTFDSDDDIQWDPATDPANQNLIAELKRISAWYGEPRDDDELRARAATRVKDALRDTGWRLQRVEGRLPAQGLLEEREFGPALRDSLIRTELSPELVLLNHPSAIANWTRPTTKVDLVVSSATNGAPEIVAELKVWDIGHQLFDLAKLCCLLSAGATAGFLVCVAKTADDFERMPGGELFPEKVGDSRTHGFADLIETHREEWGKHVGRGAPEPTNVPHAVQTRAVAAGIDIAAYPGHSARAVLVEIRDPTPLPLAGGWKSGTGNMRTLVATIARASSRRSTRSCPGRGRRHWWRSWATSGAFP